MNFELKRHYTTFNEDVYLKTTSVKIKNILVYITLFSHPIIIKHFTNVSGTMIMK